ncbi:MAG: CoA transferase [Alphaproteobacteria bacterium]|nr:CoA transferase [Alphaproteobacteria bacterium]
MTGPLSGVTVLDFTRVLAGPWCTLALADLGAEVIKIENPKGGDDTRRFDARAELAGESAYFLFANRNKKSLALNIAAPEGREVARRIAARADILVENFRPGVMARLGLDFESLCEINPRLVYCSISGYGHNSPLREVAGYDPVAQAEGGMMAITGEADGGPLRTGISYADIFSGYNALQGVLAALYHRERTGEGQAVDIALLDGAVASLANQAQVTLLTGEDTGRYGNDHPFLEPFGLAETADGPLYLVIGNERQWERFCRDVIARPDLLDHPHFRDNAARLANREENRAVLAGIFASDTRAGWMAKFRAAGVPAGAVRNISEALAAPEVRARGMVQPVDHPRAGRFETVASPVHLSATPTAAPVAAPMLGQHTDAVLAAFGYGAEEIARFREDGVTA